MPIENLGFKHITQLQMDAFDTALNQLIDIVNTVTQNLTEEERVKYGSINEKYKLLTNGVNDYANTQPDLKSPDVNWVEFTADYQDRAFADTRSDKIVRLNRALTDFKIVHDYDNFQAALTDYDYTKYKSNTNTPGFTEKYNYLKQFFANTGKSSNSNDAATNNTPSNTTES